MSKRGRTIAIVAVSGALVLGGAAAAVAASVPHAAVANPGPLITTKAAPETPTGSISNGASITTDQALAFLKADTAEFAGTTYAKSMTLGQLSSQSSFDPGNALGADEPVIVAVSDGSYVPGFGHGEKFTWGAMVFDQNTGVLIGTFANPGKVPAFLAQ